VTEEDRDKDETRDGIAQASRNWMDLNHRMGNSSMSLDEARRRVFRARARGDILRENGNR